MTCISYHIIIADAVINYFKLEDKTKDIQSYNDLAMTLMKSNKKSAPNKPM
jgi:hypothetical protein